MYINNGIFHVESLRIMIFRKIWLQWNKVLKRIRELFERSPQEKMRIYIYINMIELTIEEYGYSWRIKEWDYILRKSSG